MDIYYINEYREFIAFSTYDTIENVIKFDQDFNIKEKNNYNE